MTTASLTIAYQQPAAETGQWLRLAQEPVSSNHLTPADLQAMLALVQSGISARAYKPANCEASITAEQVTAELGLRVWPSSLAIGYTLTADLLTIGTGQQVREWREFDLIVPMADQVELPYLCEQATLTWQTPAYNRSGEQVALPAVAIYPAALELSGEVFGVLRVRCLALGWRHVLSFAMAKTDTHKITSLKPSVTVTWAGGSLREAIELPGCLEALLEYCPDGNSKRARAQSTVDNDDDETVPVVYWSPCSGRMLTVRQERP